MTLPSYPHPPFPPRPLTLRRAHKTPSQNPHPAAKKIHTFKAAPRKISSPSNPLGTLTHLPPELRAIIYTNILLPLSITYEAFPRTTHPIPLLHLSRSLRVEVVAHIKRTKTVTIATSLSLRNLVARHATLPRHIVVKLFANVKMEWTFVRNGPLRKRVLHWQYALAVLRERGGVGFVTLDCETRELERGLVKIAHKAMGGREMVAERKKRDIVEWMCDPVGCSGGKGDWIGYWMYL